MGRMFTGLCALAFVVTFGCGSDAATADCADCADLTLQPACIEAANACDQFSGSDQQTCLEEARALCD